jgi:outer membrane protein assembly factor BamD
VAALGLFAAGAGACAHGHGNAALPDPGSVDADKFLFDKGTDLLKQKHWLAAREYFKKLIDTYPQSGYRNDARLGVGDAYMGEGHLDSYILGVNEFRQFLQFAPLNPKADYAQYQICVGQSKQMLGSQRDQSATVAALADCDAFLRNHPSSPYRPQAERVRRQVRDRLSDHQFEVGLTYFRLRVYSGAGSRFQGLILEDPGYTRIDRVFYYLGEMLYRSKRPKEALPMYARLLNECPKSQFVKQSRKRVAELKAAEIKR